MFNSMRESAASMIVASLLAFSSISAIATEQQAASGGQQAPTEKPAAGGGERQGRGQGGGGRGPGTTPLNLDDRSGFSPIFDGTMKNWDGDPALWKAENGMLVGETTADERAEGELVRHLARRRTGGLRAESGIPDELDQQRHPVPQPAPAAGPKDGRRRLPENGC